MSLCQKCYGTGTYFGMGMMPTDCECGFETIHSPTQRSSMDKPASIDRRSKAYKEAIDKIVKSNNCSRDEAVEAFDSEFQKIA